MAHLDGVHHMATLTADLDRLIAFYERVFDARVVLDLEEEGLRHVFIELGPNTFLHPFQIPGVDVPQGAIPLFARGRLDHFALNAPTFEIFRELWQRVVAEGANDGEVSDLGYLLVFGYIDPDGASHEIVWTKPDPPADATGRRDTWQTIDLDTWSPTTA